MIAEINDRIAKDERVLITTLTKKMSEDLTDYLKEIGIKVRYLHSEIKTLERMSILRDLRLGTFHVLIGINLLREGLDLPEVSLVAILDADKEGFLRSERSLIQTIGRAARNSDGKVILYGDKVTDSMDKAMKETERRRTIQMEYNEKHGITPQTIRKKYVMSLRQRRLLNPKRVSDRRCREDVEEGAPIADSAFGGRDERCSQNLQFERAAELRDALLELRAE